MGKSHPIRKRFVYGKYTQDTQILLPLTYLVIVKDVFVGLGRLISWICAKIVTHPTLPNPSSAHVTSSTSSSVRSPSSPIPPPPPPVTPYAPYWVLTTDYTSVAVVYTCTDILHLFHVDYAWILGRSRFLQPQTVLYAKQLLVGEGVDIFRMKATDQLGCRN